MTKNGLIAALCVLALGACATHHPKFSPLEERKNPQVTLSGDGKQIVVPEVIYFFSNEKDVTITWALPAGKGLSFPKDGIRIDGAVTDRVITSDNRTAVVLDPAQREIINCEVQKDGQAFTCLNRNTKPGVYKYTIRVRQPNGEVLQRDPPIVNML